MRILAWVIAAAVGIVVIAFAVANRGPLAISVAPFPFRLDIPIWALAVGALAVGVPLRRSGALAARPQVASHGTAAAGDARVRSSRSVAGARKQLDEVVRGQRATVPAATPVSLTTKDLA